MPKKTSKKRSKYEERKRWLASLKIGNVVALAETFRGRIRDGSQPKRGRIASVADKGNSWSISSDSGVFWVSRETGVGHHPYLGTLMIFP